MNKIVYGTVLVALGVVVGVSLRGWGERGRAEPAEERPEHRSLTRYGDFESGDDRHAAPLQHQLEQLSAQVTAEANERRRLTERMEGLATELAALRGRGDGGAHTATAEPASAAAAPPKEVATNDTATAAKGEDGTTSMERALVAAGIGAPAAVEIKRRNDQLALSEIYLRDQATRDGWLDTPRFAEEMAKIDAQRTSVRDEIGDAAYDRYLAALDQPNRVAVNEVLLDSPAAAAGLQAGDVVLRYGDTRIFAPSELVAATRGGVADETVRMEIIRAGQRIEVDVPRGPLVVRIAASRGAPDEG
ncbi:MAG: PDZ domain-containing protein [Gaiellaceae bacterium]